MLRPVARPRENVGDMIVNAVVAVVLRIRIFVPLDGLKGTAVVPH